MKKNFMNRIILTQNKKAKIFVKHKYYINVPLDEIENGNYKIAFKIGEYNYTTDYWLKKTIFI